MQNIIIYLRTRKKLILLFFCFLFSSCAYFNTFYNAEFSYNKALKIIEESNIIYEEEDIPAQSKKLLTEAIENSKLVLQKYPNSKYIDDAFFIIGKASFLKGEVAVAESYFNKLIKFYPESKFYSLSEIWLAYTYLRMGLIDTTQNMVSQIQSNSILDKGEYYLIHNILAEVAIIESNIDSIYYHYENAIEYANSNSKKTSLYGKLVKVAEKNLDKIKASDYLIKLADVAPQKMRIDTRMKWITYQREIGNFDVIITEIQKMLGMSEFEGEYLRLELELGKVYVNRGDLELAKEIFGQFVENYSKKDETAEAYYQLGIMALKEDFNLNMAKDYFESSKKERASSFYGRESRDYLNKITRYETLKDIYKDATKNPDEEIEIDASDFQYQDDPEENEEYQYKSNRDRDGDSFRDRNIDLDFGSNKFNDDEYDSSINKEFGPVGTSPDSILFMIGEMLLYDFNHLDFALNELATLAEDYPNSKFASQALYVLSHFRPEEGWGNELKINFPNSPFLYSDSTIVDTSRLAILEIERDFAWSLSKVSYEDSFWEFNKLYMEYNDTLAAYIRAFISDYYLNDIDKTLKYYHFFVDSFPSHIYYSKAVNRLDIIKKDIETKKYISEQSIDYIKLVNFFKETKDFDSTKILLDTFLKGEKSEYKTAAKKLKNVIKDYSDLKKKIIQAKEKEIANQSIDSIRIEIDLDKTNIKTESDSLIYQFAQFLFKALEFKDSAIYYYTTLHFNYPGSKYHPFSIMALKDLDKKNNWNDTLKILYPDTSFAYDSTMFQLAYHSNVYKDGFVLKQKNMIEVCDSYLDFFVQPVDSNVFHTDSTLLIDSLSVKIDSSVVQFDSVKINNVKLANQKFESKSDSIINTMDSTFFNLDSINHDKGQVSP